MHRGPPAAALEPCSVCTQAYDLLRLGALNDARRRARDMLARITTTVCLTATDHNDRERLAGRALPPSSPLIGRRSLFEDELDNDLYVSPQCAKQTCIGTSRCKSSYSSPAILSPRLGLLIAPEVQRVAARMSEHHTAKRRKAVTFFDGDFVGAAGSVREVDAVPPTDATRTDLLSPMGARSKEDLFLTTCIKATSNPSPLRGLCHRLSPCHEVATRTYTQYGSATKRTILKEGMDYEVTYCEGENKSNPTDGETVRRRNGHVNASPMPSPLELATARSSFLEDFGLELEQHCCSLNGATSQHADLEAEAVFLDFEQPIPVTRQCGHHERKIKCLNAFATKDETDGAACTKIRMEWTRIDMARTMSERKDGSIARQCAGSHALFFVIMEVLEYNCFWRWCRGNHGDDAEDDGKHFESVGTSSASKLFDVKGSFSIPSRALSCPKQELMYDVACVGSAPAVAAMPTKNSHTWGNACSYSRRVSFVLDDLVTVISVPQPMSEEACIRTGKICAACEPDINQTASEEGGRPRDLQTSSPASIFLKDVLEVSSQTTEELPPIGEISYRRPISSPRANCEVPIVRPPTPINQIPSSSSSSSREEVSRKNSAVKRRRPKSPSLSTTFCGPNKMEEQSNGTHRQKDRTSLYSSIDSIRVSTQIEPKTGT